MRSTRSSNNVEHETRRSEYYYHHNNRTSTNHSSQNNSEINGYGTSSGSEYRSSKRTASSVTQASTNSSLIKRMKSSPNSLASSSVSSTTNNNNVSSTKENGRDHPTLSKTSSKSLPTTSASVSFDTNECHQASYGGYCLEENEAVEGESLVENATQAFDSLHDTTLNLKKIVLEILESKKSSIKNSGDANNKMTKVFNELKVKGLANLMQIKHLNRIEKYRLKEARQRFNLSKEKVDKIHLQLQNLQYEVMHLQKEQKTCASFRSKDESLQLVDSNKFYLSDSVPEHLRHLITVSSDGLLAQIDDSASNEERHKLHLARLDWELQQRISSEEELKSAEESRFRLEVEISAKRRTLAQFDPTLRNIIQASKPLVSQLNVPLQVYNPSNLLTPYLPQPLYVLYVQLSAYKGAFGVNYDVHIKGTVEEAQEYEARLKKETDGYFFNNMFDEDDDKQQDDDEDETEYRSKSKNRFHHQSSSENKESLLNGDQMDVSSDSLANNFAQKHSKLLQCHPIKVNLVFRFRHYQMIIIFTYYSKLELIGVNYSIENLSNATIIDPEFSVTNYSSNLFSKLLSSFETGYKSPNSTIEHLLRRNEIDSFTQLLPYVGYAYDWAQRMAGIEFLHPDKQPMVSSGGIIRVKSSIAIDSLDKTIKAIKCRFQARVNLQEQIVDIQTKKFIDTNKFESLLDSNEMYDDLDKTLLKPNSSIKSFQRLTSEYFLNEIERYPNKKRQLVDYFDYENSDDNESSHDLFDQNNFIFKLVIDSGIVPSEQSYVLNVIIIVPHNYPQKWPFFILNFDNSPADSSHSFLEPNWLRSLEEHINVRLPLKVTQQAKKIDEAIHSTTLLLRQIYDLQYGLDVIVDARKQLITKSNQSLEVYSGPKCVNSFTSLSIVQGRDHSLKFLGN